jgi:hypothetical protein
LTTKSLIYNNNYRPHQEPDEKPLAFVQSPAYHADVNAGKSNDAIEEVENEDFSENEDDANIQGGGQNLSEAEQHQRSNSVSHKADSSSNDDDVT